MMTQVEKAEQFRALHRRPQPLLLPNAWDVPSARLFEEAGFPAVATSSAGLMVSLGYPDGEVMPRRELVRTVARIASRLAIPLSADIVAGYGRTPRDCAATAKMILRAGAIGINLEDGHHSAGSLAPAPGQVKKLKAIRAAASASGVPLVINARTDALRYAPGDPETKLREAIDRLIAYRDAGADCVYPMGLSDAASIQTVVDALDFPVNVMVRPGLPPVAELERIGVKRISFGPSASYAALGLLRRASEEIREHGTYSTLTEGALTFDELNRLALPRRP